jgi:hypothetical protein
VWRPRALGRGHISSPLAIFSPKLVAYTLAEIDVARRRAVRIGKLSDTLIGFLRFGIGLDGTQAWISGFGHAYSLMAGGLCCCSACGCARQLRFWPSSFLSSASEAPLARSSDPSGHKWSADMLAKTIDNTLYVKRKKRGLADDPELANAVDQARAGRRRIVFIC